MYKIEKVNSIELYINKSPFNSLTLDSRKRKNRNLKTGKRIKKNIHDELCIYGVKLDFEEMCEVLLAIGGLVYRKEYLANPQGLIDTMESRKFMIGSAYEAIKKKGEIYDFDGVRVLNIYNFFEHFEFNKRYTDIEDVKQVTRTFRGGKTKTYSRFYVDVFGAYTKLIDACRNYNEKETYVFGVYVATVNRDDSNIFLYQNDSRVVNNFKKYCVPVLKSRNKIRKPSFHFVTMKE